VTSRGCDRAAQNQVRALSSPQDTNSRKAKTRNQALAREIGLNKIAVTTKGAQCYRLARASLANDHEVARISRLTSLAPFRCLYYS
jgi:hypothetical protein